MHKIPLSLLLVIGLFSVGGCLPATRVIKNPDDHDKGVRYYRPKPYLFVKPMLNKSGEPVTGYVNIEQTVMPDFSEEYSIHICSGLGTNTTEVTLTDGWRLDNLNVELDSQFDENVRAAADLVESIPVATQSEDGPSMAVRATNVPIGYYEAVISKDCDGKKRLYGFRYVGFMPYSACPIESCGVEQATCYDSQVYGLVVEDGAMVFRLLHDVASKVDLDRINLDKPEPTVIRDQDEEEEDPLDDLTLFDQN